tara:strand:+ start:629 stop:796 length:168 start_codon:yes stop_codon:yes gene_type:complete
MANKKNIQYFANVDLNIKDQDFKAGDEIKGISVPRWMVLQDLVSPDSPKKLEEEE